MSAKTYTVEVQPDFIERQAKAKPCQAVPAGAAARRRSGRRRGRRPGARRRAGTGDLRRRWRVRRRSAAAGPGRPAAGAGGGIAKRPRRARFPPSPRLHLPRRLPADGGAQTMGCPQHPAEAQCHFRGHASFGKDVGRFHPTRRRKTDRTTSIIGPGSSKPKVVNPVPVDFAQ